VTAPARGPGRLRLLLPSRGGDRRASALAFALQLALLAVVVPSFVVPIAVDLLRDDAGRPVTPERISFITAVPHGVGSPEEPMRDGGDGRAASTTPAEAAPVVPIVAPTEVPTGVPAATPREDPGGVGPLVGGGGPTRGVRPSFSDRRLWLPEAEIILAPTGPQTRAESLRVMLAERALVYLDSVADANPRGREPGDWTIERNGKKYGIDQRMIRLGDFSLPTALLALMPMNVQGNPMAMERATRLASMRNEIQWQAARMARDEEFRDAVRALRERKERERKEAAEKAAAEPARRP
jgi:hypothetical protein